MKTHKKYKRLNDPCFGYLVEIIDTTGTKNILNEKPQVFREIERCIWCDGEVDQRSTGNEGWGICEDCGTVEGDTKIYYECSLCLKESETEECNCKKS